MAERLECDLVMRGGITSGIVYPRAIAKLAETYDFRSIGGTSAGAMPPLQRPPRLTAPRRARITSRRTSRAAGEPRYGDRRQTRLERLFQPRGETGVCSAC